MRLSLRLLLGFFLLVAVAAWFVLNIFLQEVKPGVRRATEGTLIDTAQLLAQLTAADLANQPLTRDSLARSALARALSTLNQRPIGARIDGIQKDSVDYRLYVTDRHGIVLFDSTGRDLGADYSRWNDVYLTLQGRYGARSSRDVAGDPKSSVMYVAAPLLENGQIRGVLTVGKPNRAMDPVIARSERTIQWAAILLLGIALTAGGGMVWWLNRSLHRLEDYAAAVSRGEPVSLPRLGSPELMRLGQALENMRRKLEGKAYVEQYVHSLTHELKSPLAAHRDLAYRLNIGLGSVTKAYQALEARGLVASEQGRGMFVRIADASLSPPLDLSLNAPPQLISDQFLASSLRKLARRLDAASFGAYVPPAGRPDHRAAKAGWLRQFGVPATGATTLLTNGAQQALALCIGLAQQQGRALLVEEVTYPGIIDLCHRHGVKT